MHFITELISGVFGLIFFVITLVLVVYAVMDIIKSSRFNTNTKLLWIIIIILLPILGSLLYIFWGRNQNFV